MYERLGDLLPNAISKLKVAKTVDAARICETMTAVLASHWDHAVPMRAVTYRGGTVTVAVTSSGWSHEVTMNAVALVAKVNERLGDGTVKQLKTRVSPDAAHGS